VDVEDFLHNKAIEFAKQGVANTHLVYTSYKDKPVLIGYYSLANKQIAITNKIKLSSKNRQRLNRFAGPPLGEGMPKVISAPLIAQLGKNFTNGYNALITGDELLEMACDKVKKVLNELSGKVVYVECEDTPKLVEFYARNGFVSFDKRIKDRDERQLYQSDYLVQMLRYF
jgi:hypothetical protein